MEEVLDTNASISLEDLIVARMKEGSLEQEMLKPFHNYFSLTLWVITLYTLPQSPFAHHIPQTLQSFRFQFHSLLDLQNVTQIHTLPNLLDHFRNVLAGILSTR